MSQYILQMCGLPQVWCSQLTDLFESQGPMLVLRGLFLDALKKPQGHLDSRKPWHKKCSSYNIPMRIYNNLHGWSSHFLLKPFIPHPLLGSFFHTSLFAPGMCRTLAQDRLLCSCHLLRVRVDSCGAVNGCGSRGKKEGLSNAGGGYGSKKERLDGRSWKMGGGWNSCVLVVSYRDSERFLSQPFWTLCQLVEASCQLYWSPQGLH